MTVASYTKITEEWVYRKLAAGKKTTKTDWAAGDRCAEIQRKTVHNTAAAYKTLYICSPPRPPRHSSHTKLFCFTDTVHVKATQQIKPPSSIFALVKKMHIDTSDAPPLQSSATYIHSPVPRQVRAGHETTTYI